MINEIIKEIYIKGNDDRYPIDYPIIQTGNHFYRIDLGGFEVLSNPDLIGFKPYDLTNRGFGNTNIQNAKIVEAFSDGHIIYIVLADGRFIDLGLADGSLELLVEEHDDILRAWFDSHEPRENDLQKLTKEHPRWQSRNISSA